MSRTFIFSGGREIRDYRWVLAAIKASKFRIDHGDEFVCGCGDGVDWLVGHDSRHFHPRDKRADRREDGGVASMLGIELVTHIPADWANLGPRAGPFRNQKMLMHAVSKHISLDDGSLFADSVFLIAMPGAGTGTFDTIRKARHAGITTYVHWSTYAWRDPVRGQSALR